MKLQSLIIVNHPLSLIPFQFHKNCIMCSLHLHDTIMSQPLMHQPHLCYTLKELITIGAHRKQVHMQSSSSQYISNVENPLKFDVWSRGICWDNVIRTYISHEDITWFCLPTNQQRLDCNIFFCVYMLINTMPYNFQDKPMKDQPEIGREAGYSC